ncbi:MAG: mechanosensitive ion channel [Sphingomonadales bacterium]|nr:mechanosensitive ion channel [Sphingomonadales bacterium]
MTFNEHLGRIGAILNQIGFDVGKYRISVYTALSTVVVIVALIVVARLGSRLARRTFARLTRLDPGQQLLGEKIVSIAIWLIAFFLGIDLLGIDLTALAVFSGAFGLAVGFGLQKTFGNLIAGIILLMDRSIKPGDVITVNDGVTNTVGQVKKIGLRAVSVTTRDKKEYLIPNENLMINQVENWSYSSRDVRVRVALTVSPGTDLDLAERLMLQAARESARVLTTPAPAAWITEFTGIGVAWKLFQENGVTLPNANQRELGLRDLEALREMVEGLRQGR